MGRIERETIASVNTPRKPNLDKEIAAVKNAMNRMKEALRRSIPDEYRR